jgi:DNA-binding CsgD family transcriptional regulator
MPDSHRTLTARELEVAALVSEGMNNVDIAQRLGCSPSTVKIHVANIKARLGLFTRAEIIAWFVERMARDAANGTLGVHMRVGDHGTHPHRRAGDPRVPTGP